MLLVRVAVGLVGALLLVAGARWYRPGIGLAAFVAGCVGMVESLDEIQRWVHLPLTPVQTAVAVAIGGLSAMASTFWLHRLALYGIGAVVGLIIGVGAASMTGVVWLPIPFALVGLIGFPFLFDQLLKIVTPAIGAVAIGWAVGQDDNLILMSGLWIAGTAVQVLGGGGASPKKPSKARKKKAVEPEPDEEDEDDDE